MPIDTHYVEGVDSKLKNMCDMAPSMRQGLATDRLQNREGYKLSARDACTLDVAVSEEMRSPNTADSLCR